MMRALVVGASGFVGGYLRRILTERGHQVWGTYHSSLFPGLVPLDIADREATLTLVADLGPDVIFHPAAVPDVDWCETFPAESYRVNVVGLGNVLEAARRQGARLIYFSTEYVFDGRAGPYAETDPPNPLSIYGRQKLAGEEMVLAQGGGDLIVRTTVVYGWERRGKNFVERLITELASGRPVKVPQDQVSSPTYVVDLAGAACELAERECSGLYHVAGSGRAGRHSFALAAADVFRLDKGLILPVPSTELGQKAPRPLSAGLSVDKLRRVLGWAPAGFHAGLARMERERSLWQAERT